MLAAVVTRWAAESSFELGRDRAVAERDERRIFAPGTSVRAHSLAIAPHRALLVAPRLG